MRKSPKLLPNLTGSAADIKRYNSWYDHVSVLSAKERNDEIKEIISDLKHRAKVEKNKKVAQLAELLEDKSKCKVVGFMPYIEYCRAFGSADMLNANYLHAWGGAALVVKLHDLPATMIVTVDMVWTDHEGFKG